MGIEKLIDVSLAVSFVGQFLGLAGIFDKVLHNRTRYQVRIKVVLKVEKAKYFKGKKINDVKYLKWLLRTIITRHLFYSLLEYHRVIMKNRNNLKQQQSFKKESSRKTNKPKEKQQPYQQ